MKNILYFCKLKNDWNMNQDLRNIFGRRLNQARQMKGLSMDELGNALNPTVTRQAIYKYEKGQTMPDSRMLLAFGEVLGVKPEYFFRPFTVEVDRIMFRKNAKFAEKKSIAIRERVREELERYLEAEQLCGTLALFSLQARDIVSPDDICVYAKDVRSMLKLGMDGISNVIEVLEENGVKVIEISEDESFEGLSGFANDNIPVIVVNDNLGTEHKRFILLHELGHILMKFNDDISYKEAEDFCNIFASELLLPSFVIVSRLGSKRHDISLAELADIQRQYGISVDAIMSALRRLDVITARRFDGYLKKKRNFPDFRATVERTISRPETTRRFVRMVYRALADEVITFSKAASLLNTSVETVKSQLQLV